jgi:hypothetical protein
LGRSSTGKSANRKPVGSLALICDSELALNPSCYFINRPKARKNAVFKLNIVENQGLQPIW